MQAASSVVPASAVRLVVLWTFGLMLFAPGQALAQTYGSCAGYCGGSSPDGCYCDSACTNYGDCCSDYQSYCGGGGPTCASMCNSSSDCGYQCPVGDGSTSWCGHYTCYTPEETEDAPCNAFCDSTSDCSAACKAVDGTDSTCGSYTCNWGARPLLSISSAYGSTSPCVESGSGASWTRTCDKSSSEKTVGGTALGMKGWTYYSTRLARDTVSAQAGARARFFIAGYEIGSSTEPALDAYVLARPISTDCKNSQTGIYLRAKGSVVWKKTLDKTCLQVANVTQLPGTTCTEIVLNTQSGGPYTVYDTRIPYASISFSFNVHGITARISAEGRAKLQYKVNSRITTGSTAITITPAAIGYISGAGAVGVGAFGVGCEIGVKGTANVVHYDVPNTVEYSVPNAQTTSTHYTASYIHKAVSYDLYAFLRAYFWFGSKTWNRKIGGHVGSDSPPSTILDEWSIQGWDGLTPLDCVSTQNNFNHYWSTCGDGVCNGTESCSSCASDCGSCGAECGDGICSYGESCYYDCGGSGGTCRVPPCPVAPL